MNCLVREGKPDSSEHHSTAAHLLWHALCFYPSLSHDMATINEQGEQCKDPDYMQLLVIMLALQ